ncbi:hypothetical protein GOV13_00290 [Candidatus Pacearchaeota archaeon]|nr:hypothetical protein [Candidatus Pacearchaeota archaeon]
MEFKTISDIENPLFERREIEGEIHAEITPSRQNVAKLLAEKFSVPAENIKIRTIMGKFGSKVFIINANIYKSAEDKDKLEIKKKKDAVAETKSVEEDKPAETPKEEVKEEEKPVEEDNLEEPVQDAPVETPKEEDKPEEVKE